MKTDKRKIKQRTIDRVVSWISSHILFLINEPSFDPYKVIPEGYEKVIGTNYVSIAKKLKFLYKEGNNYKWRGCDDDQQIRHTAFLIIKETNEDSKARALRLKAKREAELKNKIVSDTKKAEQIKINTVTDTPEELKKKSEEIIGKFKEPRTRPWDMPSMEDVKEVSRQLDKVYDCVFCNAGNYVYTGEMIDGKYVYKCSHCGLQHKSDVNPMPELIVVGEKEPLQGTKPYFDTKSLQDRLDKLESGSGILTRLLGDITREHSDDRDILEVIQTDISVMQAEQKSLTASIRYNSESIEDMLKEDKSSTTPVDRVFSPRQSREDNDSEYRTYYLFGFIPLWRVKVITHNVYTHE
jgi:hypothetical protein